METLPDALQPLAAYHQWVVWIAVPHETKPGKFKKLPVNWRDGSLCDAHNPTNWTSATVALAMAPLYDRGHGSGAGFVFTKADPFFFLDIDNCWTGSDWSPLAHDLCRWLAGAAVEVSHSGQGLHIIGCAAPVAHGCRNTPQGLELYTSDRYVALTGHQAMGDARQDCTAALADLAAELFPRATGGAGAGGEWTTGPVPGYGGPADDEELIRKASRPNAGAMFQGKTTFADLWAGRTPPDQRSESDQALASHLAFWTGKDCERMERLMRRSGLVRDKWDTPRPEGNYLRKTILSACALVTNVATATKPPAGPASTGAELAVAGTVALGSGRLTSSDWRVTFDGQAPSKPPKELVKGLLPADGVCFIGGQSGAGKTFVGVDLGVALSSAAPDGSSSYCGHRIPERVGVVIIAAEGEATLANRIEVAKRQQGISDDLPLACIGGTFDLSNPTDRSKLKVELDAISAKFTNFGARLGVILIDTMAAAFNINDENSNSECTKAISDLAAISHYIVGLVIALHHYGKSQESGLRGGSALRAGADAIISVLADRNELTGAVSNRRVVLSKSRTDDEGLIAKFDLQFVPLGVDDDGDVYGACAVIPDYSTHLSASVKHRRPRKYDATFRSAVDEALRSYGQVQQDMTGLPTQLAVCLSTVRSEFMRRFPTNDPDHRKLAEAARKAFERTLGSLACEYKTATAGDGEVWIWRIALWPDKPDI